MHVVGHVAEAAGGVDRLRVGETEEAAQVGRDDPDVVGQRLRDVAPEAPGREVAVDEQHRPAVGGAGGPNVIR